MFLHYLCSRRCRSKRVTTNNALHKRKRRGQHQVATDQPGSGAKRRARSAPSEKFRDFDAVCLIPCCSLEISLAATERASRANRLSRARFALRAKPAVGGALCAHGHWATW
jgi:hypothetical protein